jgi:hypothetical protein
MIFFRFWAILTGVNIVVYIIWDNYFFHKPCPDLDCMKYTVYHEYFFYFGVYIWLNGAYVLLFKVLNLFDKQDRKKINKWLFLVLGMFVGGYILYCINSYYWNRFSSDSWYEWLFTMIFEYLYDIYLHLDYVIISIFNLVWTSWWFLRRNSTKASTDSKGGS